MANPNQSGEDFQVSGVSLMTYAYNVWTLLGRERFPPRVGDNVRIPYRNGRIWQPKTFDQQIVTLGMWVKGTDINGVIPPQGARAQMNSNLRALKRLFAPNRTEIQLKRTLLYVTGMETHTATAEVGTADQGFQQEMDLQPITPRYGTFTVDLVMADPWWYGAVQTPTVTAAGATINNIGDVEADSLVITFNGPLTNPMLRNTSVSPVVSVWYNGTIASGAYVTIDCGLFTAINNIGASVVGSVLHAGDLHWQYLQPGNNVMTLTNQATGGSPGTGNAVVSYSPPYT